MELQRDSGFWWGFDTGQTIHDCTNWKFVHQWKNVIGYYK